MDEELALGANYEKANLRKESDSLAGNAQSVIFYLDMREAYDILNRHRDSLPADLGRELKANTPSMDMLVPIRNRIMHGRPLHNGDVELAVSVCQRFNTRYWSTLRETIDQLVADPLWEPAFQRQETDSDRIIHNLPLAEYDETGLIGRSDDCKAVVNHLLRRREPIITITGEGGIGKTAVALEAAYMLADDPASPYECILWTSLKTERLTAHGVEQIVNSVRDLKGAARNLGKTFDSDFKGGIRELAEILDGIETLLIIDNLETVHGSEVIDLYETLPHCVTYLFTSRLGVGQFERRLPLGPLSDRDASTLFRSFARSRNASQLATLSKETILQVVSRLRNSPLAIRWYILSVEAGQQPLSVLSSQDDLLDFCVRSVYEAMSRDARQVLTVLLAVDRSVTFDEIAIFAEVTVDDLKRCVQELTVGSLVRLERDTESPLISRIALTEAAQSYLRRVNPADKALVDGILAREQDLRKEAERRRIDEHERSLAPVVVRVRSGHDEPAAHLLRRALMRSKEGSLRQAISELERARSLTPDYWEVDRVEGFILSANAQVDPATSAYLSALRKADDEGKAVVSHFLAGHLARKAHEPDRAIQYARMAHKYFNTAETAQSLGNYLVWVREFEEGQAYLETALEQAEGRVRLITLTALVDSWRRWAEYLFDHEHKVAEAAQKAIAAFRTGYTEICLGVHDRRLAGAVLESVNTYLRCITVAGFESISMDRQTIYMLREVGLRASAFRLCRGSEYLPGYLRKLARVTMNQEIRRSCQLLIESFEDFEGSGRVADKDPSGEVQQGEIVRWKGRFGFIKNQAFPNGIFFPAAAIEDIGGRGEDMDLQGRLVDFIPGRGLDGRARADWVRLL
ncbi:NB-ARC domain-containing protein [Nonomuraea wenchangensis]|uniref:NB-ARC domain-containing protein n=1 Tax=Nonomuraea wenchangensis TaxID=568860 RepID=UPI003717BDC1